MLEKVKSDYSPQPRKSVSTNAIQFFDIFEVFDDVADWISDAADVAMADIKGFPEGAAAGGTVGAILEAGGAVGATATGAVVGGIISAAGASAKAYKNLNDSTGTGGIIVRRPTVSPYGSTTMPNSIDSIGWLHNEAVIYMLTNMQTGNASDFQSLARNWGKNVRGYHQVIVDSVTHLNNFTPLINNASARALFNAYGQQLRDYGLTTEGDYIDSLASEIVYLHNNQYSFAAVLSLIAAYRDEAANLGISATRRTLIQRQLTIMLYSIALWDANGGV